jgi:hypothetical protein
MRTGGWPEYDHPVFFLSKVEDEEIFSWVEKAYQRAVFKQRSQSNYKDKRAPMAHVRPHTHYAFGSGFVVLRARDFRELFVGEGGREYDELTKQEYLGWTRSTW